MALSAIAAADPLRAIALERSDGQSGGRACDAAIPATTLFVADDPASPAFLRLPGEAWADAQPLAPGRYRVSFHGRPIGSVERTEAGWRARLDGGDEDCSFDAWDAQAGALAGDVVDGAPLQVSIALERALGRALDARSHGQSRAARDALAQIGREPGAARPLRYRAYLHLARMDLEAGDASEAAAALDDADKLELRLAAFPRADVFRRSLGLRLTAARGEHERAVAGRRELEDALAARSTLWDEDRVANRVYLAVAQIALHRPADAAVALADVEPRFTSRLPRADPVRVDAEIARAQIDRARGAYGVAAERLAASLRDVAGVDGTRNLAYAQLGASYAQNAALAGRPLEAISALNRSVAWFVAELGPDNEFTLHAREALAYALALVERLPEAIAIQREVVRAYDNARSTITERIVVRHILANLLGRDGRYAESRALLEGALDDAVRAGVRPGVVAHMQLDLAYVLWQTRGPAPACQRVDDVRVAVAGGLVLAENLTSELDLLEAACRAQTASDDGIARLRRVVARRVELFGEDGIGVLSAQAMLGRAQIGAGDLDGARATLTDFAASVERLRRIETPDATGARNAFAEWLVSNELYAGYRDLAYLHARAGDTLRAIELAESVRARSLNDALGLAQDIAGLPSRAQYRAGALAARLREQDAEIALMAPADPARVALEVARNDGAAELTELMRDSAARAAPAAFDVERSGRMLPPGTAFVGVQVVHGGVWAYVVRRDRPPVVVMLDAAVPLMAALEPLRTAWSEPIAARAPIWRRPDGRYVNALVAPQAEARRLTAALLADALGEALLAPLMPALRGTTAVIVAAEGPLAGIPFDALAIGGAPLAAHRDVRYAPSLTVWAARAAPAPLPRYRRDLVAIGAPDYAAMAPGAAGPLPARAFAALPGTADELARIGRMFPAGRREMIAGDQASKTRFVALARDGTLASARYLHVAAHGVLAAEAPQWSSLVLAGDAGPGYVTAAEIATLDIRAELVVLSACETALGKEIAGEGLFGLPYALAVAGARATLLTLWPVADGPTALFMRRFYARLAQPMAPAAALAATKREFMRSKAYSAPFYWAPFALYGG